MRDANDWNIPATLQEYGVRRREEAEGEEDAMTGKERAVAAFPSLWAAVREHERIAWACACGHTQTILDETCRGCGGDQWDCETAASRTITRAAVRAFLEK